MSSPEETSPATPNWVRLALLVPKEVAEGDWGAREKTLKSIVTDPPVSAQTLKRAYLALQFAEEFFQKTKIDLKGKPLNAVEDIKKWAAHDYPGAKNAARKLLKGKMTVRALRSAEKEARAISTTGELPAMLDRTRFLKQVEGVLKPRFEGWTATHNVSSRYLPPVDIYYSHPVHRNEVIVVLVHRDTEREHDNDRRVSQLIIRALALTYCVSHVILIITTSKVRMFVEEWLAANKVQKDTIELISMY